MAEKIITVLFRGPSDNLEKAVRAMWPLGFKVADPLNPWPIDPWQPRFMSRLARTERQLLQEEEDEAG
ncbi:MAG: hypothetical protein ACLFUE_03895 [Desulfobacteraceae bacterium]